MAALAEQAKMIHAVPVQPTVGRMVLYKVSGLLGEGPAIRQGDMRPGDVLPAVIVRVIDENHVNLQVFCDGFFPSWQPGVERGPLGGQWDWPTRIPQ